MKIFWQKYRYPVFIVLGVFFAFPMLSLFQRSMIWDITLINLPWRYHLSESITNGDLPLWNPWMNYGFPQMGHYETWYPVSWLISFVAGYNIGALQYEYLFTLVVAGLGFYKFSSLFKNLSDSTRFCGAVSYMLCGVFVAQASHLGYVISGAWMPFVFYYLVVFLRQPVFKNGIYLVFFYFLLVTGGYPGNTIVISYLCLLTVVVYVIRKWRGGELASLKPLLYRAPLFLLLLIGMSAVVIVPFIDLQQHITRGDLEYTNEGIGAMTGSSSGSGFLTLFSPSANCSKDPFFGKIPMLNDVYFGVIGLLASLWFMLRGRGSRYYKYALLFFGMALLFAMISMATTLPVHKWFYELVPLFDKFRFPSLFRIFSIAGLILISMFAFQLLTDQPKYRKEFTLVISAAALVVMTLFIIGPFLFPSVANLGENFPETVKNSPKEALFGLDALLFILFSVLLVLSAWLVKNKFGVAIAFLVLADLCIHTWIRNPRFVSFDVDPKITEQQIDAVPEGFPQINTGIAMRDASKQFKPVEGLWITNYSYFKYPLIEGISPYSTITYQQALRDSSLEQMLDYPFIAVFDEIKNNHVDSLAYREDLSAAVVSVKTGPNEFHFHLENCAGKYILFNHNYYPYWNFYENTDRVEAFVVDGNFYAVQLKSNSADLEIKFEPHAVIEAFFLSATLFVLVLMLVIYFAFSDLRTKLKFD